MGYNPDPNTNSLCSRNAPILHLISSLATEREKLQTLESISLLPLIFDSLFLLHNLHKSRVLVLEIVLPSFVYPVRFCQISREDNYIPTKDSVGSWYACVQGCPKTWRVHRHIAHGLSCWVQPW